MKATDKKKTAETLTEKSIFMWIGILPLFIRPLTLGQIYEMGEFVCQIEGRELDVKARILASAEMLARYKSAPMMQEVFLVCVFRRAWLRKIFRRYILNRLTVAKFQKAIEVITNAYTANFFLTSIIFLRQTNQITEPSQTTAHGQWSEE